MRWMKRSEASIIVVLDRLVLLLMLSILAAILTAATTLQYVFADIPCPLCLLQRVAMFGCCFGLIQQLHTGNNQHCRSNQERAMLAHNALMPDYLAEH